MLQNLHVGKIDISHVFVGLVRRNRASKRTISRYSGSPAPPSGSLVCSSRLLRIPCVPSQPFESLVFTWVLSDSLAFALIPSHSLLFPLHFARVLLASVPNFTQSCGANHPQPRRPTTDGHRNHGHATITTSPSEDEYPGSQRSPQVQGLTSRQQQG